MELGVPQSNIYRRGFEVRCLHGARQIVLDWMIELRAKLQPDIIFMPSLDDLHQDHHVVAEEGLRAFKRCTVFGYELPWNNTMFQTRSFFRLSQERIDQKVRALLRYESQRERTYLNEDFIRGLAVARGVQAGAPFAEAFEVVREFIR